MDKKELKSKPTEESVITWQAPEFQYQKKDVSWYWMSLIIGIILLALTVWQRNLLFAIFIIVAWLVVVYSASKTPTNWNFRLNEKGIQIYLSAKDEAARKFYDFKEMEGFDIHTNIVVGANEAPKKYGELILKIKKRFSPYLKINFPIADQEKITEFLQKYIPKEEYSESLADSFSKLIGF